MMFAHVLRVKFKHTASSALPSSKRISLFSTSAVLRKYIYTVWFFSFFFPLPYPPPLPAYPSFGKPIFKHNLISTEQRNGLSRATPLHHYSVQQQQHQHQQHSYTHDIDYKRTIVVPLGIIKSFPFLVFALWIIRAYTYIYVLYHNCIIHRPAMSVKN